MTTVPGKGGPASAGATGRGAQRGDGRIVVLTRPAGQSESLAATLRDRGWQVYDWPALLLTGLPAIDVPDPSAFDLVVFVSGNAARFYLEQLATARGTEKTAWPRDVVAATVGPGSARAFQTCVDRAVEVLQPPADAGTFDSEALWSQIERSGLRPREVMIVRGGRGPGREGSGRNWLADRLSAVGARVTMYAAYRRSAAVWPVQRLRQLRAWRAAGLRPTWVFSSREAFESVVSQIGAAAALQGWRGCRVLATHPRIARVIEEAAASCGVATAPAMAAGPPADPESLVIQTCMPQDDAVLAAIVN